MEWFTAPDAWLGRLVFQRGLAAVYLIAFLNAALQFRPLAGERGLTPAPALLRRVPFRRAPSLFHLRYSDRLLGVVARGGVAVSALLLVGAADRAPLWLFTVLWIVPWALYLSIVSIGQSWYSFGWESLLLEAGALAVLLGNERVSPPLPVMVLIAWLLFRVEFGAGLIKWRGDHCWRELTCLYHHHETQPLPGPLSRWFHLLPRPLHRLEVLANHVTQLFVPFLLFLPQPVSGAAASIVVVTQLWLVLSGNFAWLNWVTVALALALVDWSRFVAPPADQPDPPLWFLVGVLVMTGWILVLSRHPVRNLLSRRQRMNVSHHPLRLVNSYGAFGSVSRVRQEIEIEGTDEPLPGPDTVWHAYGFRGKPGDVRRRSPQVAPYHLRLDWMMWFAALSPAYGRPWLPLLIERLLEGDRALLRLLRHNPFPDRPPRWIRARVYRYRFTTRAEHRTTGDHWYREALRDRIPPTTL
ncbi:lipase maturation factor family protein [Streptomyces sp. ST2-7A]|uniref:lipase maturation factor family protein n=1 Tax=Streptomyces sp. ST2-7A TaxID=2907214 RepID=UPI001F17D4BF|nr:lipase maturation factor family protein [Streptomyces sp. ST2-7A]MCE7079606.1 lipase maturation factor family protein [Streptomyces sp. ST2-7A]